MRRLAELLELSHWDRHHPFSDENFADADLLSLHESICDLARDAAKNPDRYADLPAPVSDLLEQINYTVLNIVGIMIQGE